jgi:hypothetical protein
VTHHHALAGYWPLATFFYENALFRWWIELGVRKDYSVCLTLDSAATETLAWIPHDSNFAEVRVTAPRW